MQSGVAPLFTGPVLEMECSTQLAMHPSPMLLALTALLPLTSQELDEAIDREAADNPALERLDPPSCPICAGEPDRSCPRCRSGSFIDRDRPVGGRVLSSEPPAPSTTQSAMLQEAALLLTREDRGVAEFILGSL